MSAKVIIIAGMPASGKSTFAKEASRSFDMPVLEKDEIKEELYDTLGFTCYKEKRHLDVVATAVLLRCMESIIKSGHSVIIVNNFRDTDSEKVSSVLSKYDCKCVTVFFSGDADVFYRRYVERDNLHIRHVGHVVQEHYPLRPGDSPDHEMTREEFADKFEKLGMADFTIPGLRIDVDATYPENIDVDALIAQIRNVIE